MKPLLKKDIPSFLDRFDNFTSSEIRELKVITPTSFELTLTTQDKARAYDWITLSIAFNGIIDAKLVDESNLAHIDLSDGMSIVDDNGMFAFGVGECYNTSCIKSSVLYIVSKEIKYNEGIF
jgi:hypothetical protein